MFVSFAKEVTWSQIGEGLGATFLTLSATTKKKPQTKQKNNFILFESNFWLLAHIMRVCEPLEPQRLDRFRSFFDLFDLNQRYRLFFHEPGSALRFPALGRLLPWRHQEEQEVCSLGPTELQSIQILWPPFTSKIMTRKRKKWMNYSSVTTVKLVCGCVCFLRFVLRSLSQFCILKDAAFCRCRNH